MANSNRKKARKLHEAKQAKKTEATKKAESTKKVKAAEEKQIKYTVTAEQHADGTFEFRGGKGGFNITAQKNKALEPYEKCIHNYGVLLGLIPGDKQVAINQQIGNARVVHNDYLSKREEYYKETKKALKLLDFVSDGKVRYPGYNAELFGDNVQVETKEEAEDRVYRFVTEEASSKLLLEYAKSIKGSGNPESEIKTHPAYYLKTHPIYYNGDACRYSESMKKECDEVIASVVQKLINKIPDFAAELNQKALELLDFVPNGKVRYPGYNADLFGDNVQVETKEEAEDRVYKFITEEASSKLLLEYAKSIKGSENPESEIKTHPAYYLKTYPIYYRDTFRYSESMKKECAEVIKSVAQKLINKIPDFAAEASKEENAAKKREIEEKKAEQKKEYNDYISCVSAKRAQLAQEAKDAGFESLLEYLMFLEVYETCLTSSISGRCSLVNMFEHRKKQ